MYYMVLQCPSWAVPHHWESLIQIMSELVCKIIFTLHIFITLFFSCNKVLCKSKPGHRKVNLLILGGSIYSSLSWWRNSLSINCGQGKMVQNDYQWRSAVKRWFLIKAHRNHPCLNTVKDYIKFVLLQIII